MRHPLLLKLAAISVAWYRKYMEKFRRFLLPYALFFTIILFFVSVIIPSITFADSSSPAPCDPNNETCGELGAVPLDPGGVVNVIITYSVAIGGSIALILIIYGGFKIATANGSPVELKKGRDIITYAIIGLVLILFSALLVLVIGGGIIPIPDIGA